MKTNLEYLEKMKKEDEGALRKHCTLEGYHLQFRKMKALEIIAETLIGISGILESIDERFDGHFNVRIE